MASKYEEIYPPQVRDCVYITDKAFTNEQILESETSILTQLDYQICVPTGFHFLMRFKHALDMSGFEGALASYFAERSLQENQVLDFKPDQLAAAACYLAKRTVHELIGEWCESRRKVSGQDFNNAKSLPSTFKLFGNPDDDPTSYSPDALNMAYPADKKAAFTMFFRVVDVTRDMYDTFYQEATRENAPASVTDASVSYVWESCGEKVTGYPEMDLLGIARKLLIFADETTVTASRRTLEAARKKFKSRNNFFVSCLPHIALPGEVSGGAVA